MAWLSAGMGTPTLALALSIVSQGSTPEPTSRPPLVAADCVSKLRDGGARFSDWPVKPTLKSTAGGTRVACEVPYGVSLTRGATGLRYQPRARVNCAFGLRLANFEAVMQAEAQVVFGSRVKRIEQLGTYNCRNMAAYPDLVSEHSFANAIDISIATTETICTSTAHPTPLMARS